jgi:murein DD-endopeptidase MepM/ murein hydrolase activator NlpD
MTRTTQAVAAATAAGLIAVGIAGVATAAAPSPEPSAVTDPADPGTLDNGRQMPVRDFSVSSGWGNSTGPHAGRHHDGLDFAAHMNEPVFAATDGTIVHAGPCGGYGNMVEIKTGDGKRLIYGHLNRIGVHKGQKVHEGQRLGAVGSTGHSTGPHLHFEVRKGPNKAINPNAYLGLGKRGLNHLDNQMAKYDRKYR